MSDESTGSGTVSYKKVVVKAGTALLTHASGRLNLQVMSTLVEQLASLHVQGTGVLLVTSGAVAAGRHILGVAQGERNVPFRQVLAAAGQARLMHAYEQLFDWHQIPVAQALLTRADFDNRLGYLNVRNTIMSLLELGVIPIINENDVTASDELTGAVFGDNDSMSALLANLVDADLLVLLGQIKGLYTADPHLDPMATLVPTVELFDDRIEMMGGGTWDGQGQGGMVTKLDAARLATSSGVDVVIASGTENGVLTRLVEGERIGTFFPASATKMESRKRWMLSRLKQGNKLIIDEGARQALVNSNGSLLPAGVVKVMGSFDRGEVVSIFEKNMDRVASGISNYSSEDLEKIHGSQSDQIDRLAGHFYGDEVIHRNNMVIHQ